MAVEEIGFDDIQDKIGGLRERPSIHCSIPKEDQHHLFHQIGRISRFMRDHFLFPLISATDSASKKILKREDWFSSELFWNSTYNDVRFPKHQQIKEMFNRYDQSIVIHECGKEIKVKCRILETKDCPKDSNEGVLNHLIVQGNLSTLDNNIPALYPFLASYVTQKEQDAQLPPARFIMINHYHNTVKDDHQSQEERYLPGDVDEWTYVFKKCVESVVDTYGSLEMMSAHSLGNIPVVGHLNHVKPHEFTKLFPKVLFLSQGPSSTYEVSKNIPFEKYPNGWCYLVGAFVYYLCKWTGWDVSLDATLTDFLAAVPNDQDSVSKLKKCKVIITEVDKDYYFPGKASLCASDRLDNIDSRVSLYRMSFSPPLAWGVQRGHHNFNMGLLQRQDLVRECLHLQGEKTIHLDNPQEIVDYEVNHPMLLKHGQNVVDAVLKPIWEENRHSQSPSLEGRVEVLAG
jgi:hypothetical protein